MHIKQTIHAVGFSVFVTLLFPVALFGATSMSLIISPTDRITGNLPGTSAFSNLTSFRIEGQADNFVSHNTRVGLFEIDSSTGVLIDSSGNLDASNFGCNQIGIPLGSATDFRFVAQRNVSSGNCSLELWDDQTGVYTKATSPITSSVSSLANYRFRIGSFYEATSPDIHLGFLRWYSTNRTLGISPPTGTPASPGDLFDYEFENNLMDSGPNQINLSFAAGSESYANTVTDPPAINLGTIPLTIRTGTPTTLDASASFAGNDGPLTFSWSQVSGPGTGTWTGQTTATPTFSAPAFGTYYLRVSATDSLNQTTTKNFKIGAVATDDNGVVQVANPQISQILGPMIRFGANPWSWYDNRQKAAADNQISMMNTTWADFWDTPNPNGTISVTNGSAIVTGSGTQFQTDICGGVGNTTPTTADRGILIWYPSVDYPGMTGRVSYTVSSCNSQTQLTLVQAYVHGAGTATYSGIQYETPTASTYAAWFSAGLPADYYDNVLAYYNLYYRSGIDDYLTAARTLASRLWNGPFLDRGKVDDNFVIGGTWAGAPRTTSITGIILWSLDTDTNIWPGVHHVWDYWGYLMVGYPNGYGGWNSIGDLRESGYMTGGLALCSMYDTDPAYRASCLNNLQQAVTKGWQALMVDGTWPTFEPDAYFSNQDGTVSVNVVDGSPNITLNNPNHEVPSGDTCGQGLWCSSLFANGMGAYRQGVWFVNDSKNTQTIGGLTDGSIGDTQMYNVQSVTDPTHAVLTTPYNSGSCPGPGGCNKGMEVSHVVGFGTIPYMQGLAVGALGGYVYPALVAAGDTTDANVVKNLVAAGATWLATTGVDPSTGGLWGSRGFLNCEPNPADDIYCSSGLTLLGETQRAFAVDYVLNPSQTVQSAGDKIYQAMWAKPGYTSPIGPSTSYLVDIDDTANGGYEIVNSATSNKWLGYFFGYGFGSAWPAVRPSTNTVANPVISSFTTSSTSLTLGQSATLSWNVSNATSLSVSSVGSVTPLTSGSTSVSPSMTTTYVLTATNGGGSVTASVTVTVTTSPLTISSVSVSSLSDTQATVIWNTTIPADTQVEYGLTSAYGSISVLGTTLGTSHSVILSSLQNNTVYHYRVDSRDGSGNLVTSNDDTFATTQTIVVNNGSGGGGGGGTVYPTPTASLSASPATITLGQSVTLTWSETNATTCGGTNFTTSNTLSGSITLTPQTTTVYTLTCSGNGGTATAHATVTVSGTTGTPTLSLTPQAQSGALSATTLSPSPASYTAPATPLTSVTLTQQLVFGSRLSQVSFLQTILAHTTSVYPSGLVTGYFGSLTLTAVQKFQVQYGIAGPGLAGYGQVGPKTRTALNTLSHGGTPTTLTTTVVTTPVVVAPPKVVSQPIPALTHNTVTTPSKPTPTTASAPTIITVTLSLGSTGAQVTLLQQLLAKHPDIYPEGIISGVYDVSTQRAVERLQIFDNIVSPGDSEYGVVGIKTRGKANSL